MNCSTPGFSVHGISQARILEWVSMSSPGDLPNPGIEPTSPALAGGFFTTELCLIYHYGISYSIAFHQGTHFTTNEVWQWASAYGVHWSNNVLHHTKQLSIIMYVCVYGGRGQCSLMVKWLKNLPEILELLETWVRSLGREDPLEKKIATHSLFLPEKSKGPGELWKWKWKWKPTPGELW